MDLNRMIEMIKYFEGYTENWLHGAEIFKAHDEGDLRLFAKGNHMWHVKTDINSYLDEVSIENLTESYEFWNCTCTCGMQKCKHIAACLFEKLREPKNRKSTCKSKVDVFNILSGCINIDRERQRYTAIYDELRTKIISLLKENEFFAELYHRIGLSGSYADKLKISLPDEFDLVVYMRLPEMKYVNVLRDEQTRGNAYIDLTTVLNRLNESGQRSMLGFLGALVNEQGLLLENKFQHWMESLMAKSLTRINYEITFQDQVYKLRYTKSGPAHTLYVRRENESNQLFSVDFVPGFEFGSEKYVSDTPPHDSWVAVPLPPKPARNKDNPSFTASYACEERKMMRDKQQFKNALKLVKKFRDRNPKLKAIKSYYIKTLFFSLDKEVGDKNFWTKPIPVIMHKVFNKLEEALSCGRIEHHWVNGKNLLGQLSSSQIKQMHNEVKLVLKVFNERSHSEILNIFLTQEEQKRLTSGDRQLIADCFEAGFEDCCTAYSLRLQTLLCAFVLLASVLLYYFYY